MIVDTLERAERYFALHPGFEEAFAFLRSGVFIPGRFEIEPKVFALSEETKGKGEKQARLEAHRRYIDIQYVMEGEELIGWSPLETCAKESEAYKEEKDILFFADRPSVWLPVPKGSFAIFFPEDAHAPLGGAGDVTKIVMKVAVR